MRTVVMIVFILLILISVFWTEYVVVENFYDGLRFRSEKMFWETMSGFNIKKNAEEIESYWESQKGLLYVFGNHDYFRQLEDNVHRLTYYANNEETDMVCLFLHHIISAADESEYDFSLKIGNVF